MKSLEERLDKSIEERAQSQKRLVKDLVFATSFTTLAAVFGADFMLQVSNKTGNVVRYIVDLGATAIATTGALSYGSFVQDDKQEISRHDAAIEEISKKIR